MIQARRTSSSEDKGVIGVGPGYSLLLYDWDRREHIQKFNRAGKFNAQLSRFRCGRASRGNGASCMMILPMITIQELPVAREVSEDGEDRLRLAVAAAPGSPSPDALASVIAHRGRILEAKSVRASPSRVSIPSLGSRSSMRRTNRAAAQAMWV
ncbi:hypothetical protein BJX63DRAFT_22950 [Aspergillus granulosus]|uniref:Uncharacterized protein n=1 Tax=Aspergillus granulosus TaxID=176169 RepID=A0ABR4GZZ6_9EURO